VFVNQNGISGVYNTGTGVLTLSGTSSVANYQTALRSIEYQHTGDNPATSKTVEFKVNDGDSDSNAATKNLAITRVNDAPTLTTTVSNLSYTEGDGPVAVDGNITVADPDSTQIQGATVQITGNFVQADDELAFVDTATITGSYDDTTGTLTLTGTDTVANYQTALRSVTYENVDDNPSGTKTVSFQATDAEGAASNVATRTIDLNNANDAPVVTTSGGDTSYTEGDPATTVDGALTVTDGDDTNLEGGQVRISANFQAGDDLVFVNQNGISGVYNTGTGVLTLSGTASVADYQTGLRSIQFQTTNSNPSSPKTVEFKVNDGDVDSNAATKNVTVTGANDAPTVTTTVSNLSYTEGDGAVAVDNGLTVSDPDSTDIQGATVQITGNHVQADDELAFTNQNGITGLYNDSTGTLTLSGTTTIANYQTALRSVTFENTDDNPSGTKTVSFQATDAEGAASNVATRTIDLNNANDAPVVTTTNGSTAYTEGDPATTIDSGITVTDADDTNLESGQVRISSGFQSGDDLVFVNQNGISGVYNTGTGVLTLTGTSSVANYETALRSIQFQSTNTNPVASKTVEFKVNDGDVDSNTPTKEITVTAANSAPVVTTTGGNTAFTEGLGAVAVDTGLTVTDPDSTNLSGATVQITGNYSMADDTLAFTNQNGITGNYSALTGTMTLSGSASLADYQTALRSITFDNSSQNPTGTKTVTFQVTDDEGGASQSSATADKTIALTGVNDAPVVTNSGGSTAYTEQAAGVAVDDQITVTDVDDTNLESAVVNVSEFFESGDELVFTDQNGITGNYNSGTGVLTLTGTSSVANYQTALRSILFRNLTHDNPATSKAVDFKVNDGDVDSNQPTKNITVTRINDAPTASDQNHNVLGNVRIQVGAPGVLTGSNDPEGDTVSAQAASGTSVQGGDFTVAADGSYTYDPPAGYEGADTFDFVLCDNGTPQACTAGAGNGTVNLTVSGMIWFVDDSAAPGGDGRLTEPLNCLTGAGCFSAAARAAGDNMFLYSGNYTGGVQTLNNEKYIGQGASGANLQTIAGVTVPPDSDTLPSTGGANPIITTGAGPINGINLGVGASNTLRGFTIGNTTGYDIASGANFGTLTASQVDLNGTGGLLNLNTGTLSATFPTMTSTSSPGQGMNLVSIGGSLTSTNGTTVSGQTTQCILVSGSTVSATFNNTSCTGGTDGVSLQNNSSGTRSFGTVSVTSPSGVGFLHSVGGGTTTFGGLVNVQTPGSHGVDIQNSNANITFNGGLTVNKTAGTGDGVSITGTNTGRTFSFGAFNVTNGVGDALVQSGAGTPTIGLSGGAVSATGGSAVNVGGVTFGAGSNLTSATASGGTTPGISLVNATGPLNISGGTITGNASSDAVEITGGGPSLTYNGSVTQNNNNQRTIDVQSATSGPPTISFGGAISATTVSGTIGGINLVNNTNATIHFTGGVTLSTATAPAFTATGGGTVDVTGSANTLTTTTGTALNVQNTNIGAPDLNFRSINAGTGANVNGNGIILDNTGSSGNLVVTGTGANGTGGTIQHFTGSDGATNQCAALGAIPQGVGIFLRNTQNVSLDSMNLNDFSNFAMLGYTVSGTTTLDQMTINGTNGSNVSQDEGSVMFCGLTGSASITSSTITGGFEDGLRVVNSSGTLNRLTVSGTTLATSTNALADDAFLASATGSATMNVTVNQDTTFTTARSDLFNYVLNNTSTGDLIIDDSHFSNNHPSIVSGGGGITLAAGGGGSNTNFTYSVTNSDFRDAAGNAITVASGQIASAAGTYTGSILNNTIGAAGVALSGSSGADGIKLSLAGSGTHKTTISNNTIRRYFNAGISLLVTGTSGTPNLRATVENNTIIEPSGGINTLAGFVSDIALPLTNVTVCLDLGGLNAAEDNSLSTSDPNNFNDIDLLTSHATNTYNLPGYVGPNDHGPATEAAVTAHLVARNSGDGAPTVFADTTGNFTGAGANCL
jgi:hypothetical protein